MNNAGSRLLAFFLILFAAVLLIAAVFSFNFVKQIPSRTEVVYGPPAMNLSSGKY